MLNANAMQNIFFTETVKNKFLNRTIKIANNQINAQIKGFKFYYD